MTIDARKIEDLKNPEVTPESFPFRYLATLIQDDKDQGRDDLAFSNALVTIAAGNDTTSATTVFFLLTMAMFPEIQDKLYEEIYDLCGDDREPEISDIQKLPYLDQVLKEIQRRFTTLPIIFRKITEDAKINNVIYPAGTALLLSLANVHLDPALYPNPYQFNPDNFSPENVANRPKGSFVPFSAGPRNCIGMQIALVVMKQFIVSSLRSFSFHTTLKMEDIDLRVGFVSHNKSGCPVSLCKRKKNPLL
ncbi:hypothetical protein V9T40_006277 [Parthenolecanium corni]|uniref:Cytochrome P450 n=1 Tax=Parthenolecanium corni TaxID=536013 RepID=A0AAN9Y604_9HEMI